MPKPEDAGLIPNASQDRLERVKWLAYDKSVVATISCKLPYYDGLAP